jgi:hypothetical protein
MPCPYFEPRRALAAAQSAKGRLPLIEEYDGFCRAAAEPFEAPPEMRTRYCNHGYSRGACEHFPNSETRSALRYHLTRLTQTELEITVVEEQDYAPVAWCVVKYSSTPERLEPEMEDGCMRAQVMALCRAYLNRFPAQAYAAFGT